MTKQNKTKLKNNISFNQMNRLIKNELELINEYKIEKNLESEETLIIIKGKTKIIDELLEQEELNKMNNQNLHPKLERFIQQQNQRWEEQDKRWEEQDKRWKEQDKKWNEQLELNKEIKQFIKDQNQKWIEQDKRWEEQIKFNQEVKQFIVKQEQINEVLLSSIKEILLRLERIESLPTIQKELKELK